MGEENEMTYEEGLELLKRLRDEVISYGQAGDYITMVELGEHAKALSEQLVGNSPQSSSLGISLQRLKSITYLERSLTQTHQTDGRLMN